MSFFCLESYMRTRSVENSINMALISSEWRHRRSNVSGAGTLPTCDLTLIGEENQHHGAHSEQAGSDPPTASSLNGEESGNKA